MSEQEQQVAQITHELREHGYGDEQLDQETSLEAATLIETLFRAQQEQADPQPLTREQLIERMYKPVYCARQKRWGVVGARLDKYTIGFGYGFEWLDDEMRRGEIYATEPKGDEA